MTIALNTDALHQVAAFIWAEADLLDNEQYTEWLQLWRNDGLYIVPIDPQATDHENTLNYAYDNAHMREMRVQRLVGGESISTSPEPRTVRMASRFRITEEQGDLLTVRCAQFLTDFRKENLHQYTANLVYTLQREGTSFRIVRKVVKLINSDDVLKTIGYIL
jgi:3-phenylpropionate/cinnamic acid dioxygenase small subunit